MDLRSALELGHDLMRIHGLQGWQLGLDRAKTRAGATHYASREITLSAHLAQLHDEVDVRDTLLHEIAHAFAGPRAGHGPVWKAQARALGCSAGRCISAASPRVQGDWIGTCPAGHEVTRHRVPTRLASCTLCRRGFHPAHLLDWTFRGEQVAMHPTYTRELRALHTRRSPAAAQSLAAASQSLTTARVRVGSRVRVTAPGRYADVVGTVAKRGRTRWHVRIPGGILTVPFGLVAEAELRATPESGVGVATGVETGAGT